MHNKTYMDLFEYVPKRRFNDSTKRILFFQNVSSNDIIIAITKYEDIRTNEINKTVKIIEDGKEYRCQYYRKIFASDTKTPLKTRRYLYQRLKKYKTGIGREHRYNVSDDIFKKIIEDCNFDRNFLFTSSINI